MKQIQVAIKIKNGGTYIPTAISKCGSICSLKVFYKNHFCLCGCKEHIPYPKTERIAKIHSRFGIPKYIYGHIPRIRRRIKTNKRTTFPKPEIKLKCPRCKKIKADSPHHILPRKYGGNDNKEKYNIVMQKMSRYC